MLLYYNGNQANDWSRRHPSTTRFPFLLTDETNRLAVPPGRIPVRRRVLMDAPARPAILMDRSG
jgi:hypothetical protein